MDKLRGHSSEVGLVLCMHKTLGSGFGILLNYYDSEETSVPLPTIFRRLWGVGATLNDTGEALGGGTYGFHCGFPDFRLHSSSMADIFIQKNLSWERPPTSTLKSGRGLLREGSTRLDGPIVAIRNGQLRRSRKETWYCY